MSTVDTKSIKLTETVKKGGCAAKLPAGQLRHILESMNISKPTEMTVGTEHMDDACVWDLKNLGEGQSLVQTLDFFTPIVDDPYDFGSIAAANALSDVYAMGGTPKIALSILAFPSQVLPLEILKPLMQGALDKIHEAGAFLAGGHTIDDDTLKFGLSVTGFVPTSRVWKNTGAKAGDVLILTKALGTGTLTSALKIRELDESHLKTAIASMKQLNKVPELLEGIDVHAATDITGFGLAGHALQMARGSKVKIHFTMDKIKPLPGALKCLEKEITNRAHQTNWDYIKEDIFCHKLTDITRGILTDPQTSGGLLLSVTEKQSKGVLQRLMVQFPASAIIGYVESEDSFQKRIIVN
jgi:selenide,water dikinase